ncbi:hypothetical protein [Oscillibacter sp.]|uniref:hypothetical protein n=1 Tax=Oscillibacter sp. TaxID=1945593 RepID=UPI0028965CE4|nr:hypothetical protein [Oscillibacter sp.]
MYHIYGKKSTDFSNFLPEFNLFFTLSGDTSPFLPAKTRFTPKAPKNAAEALPRGVKSILFRFACCRQRPAGARPPPVQVQFLPKIEKTHAFTSAAPLLP